MQTRGYFVQLKEDPKRHAPGIMDTAGAAKVEWQAVSHARRRMEVAAGSMSLLLFWLLCPLVKPSGLSSVCV